MFINYVPKFCISCDPSNRKIPTLAEVMKTIINGERLQEYMDEQEKDAKKKRKKKNEEYHSFMQLEEIAKTLMKTEFIPGLHPESG